MAVRSLSTSTLQNNQPRYGRLSARIGEALPFSPHFLVVAGGGAGGQGTGTRRGGGGGAGGYRTSFGISGRNTSPEARLNFNLGETFTVTVGAGGAGVLGNVSPNPGGNSVFSTITSIGGGHAGASASTGPNTPGSGGSGGGAGDVATGSGPNGATGTAGQGFDGARSVANFGGGGGGAGGSSSSGITVHSNNAGPGLSSLITGTVVTRATGGDSISASAGAVNTGDGGNGGAVNPGFSGGSGIVILRYPAVFTLSIPGGLTSSTTVLGDEKVTTFTAGTGTVTIG